MPISGTPSPDFSAFTSWQPDITAAIYLLLLNKHWDLDFSDCNSTIKAVRVVSVLSGKQRERFAAKA